VTIPVAVPTAPRIELRGVATHIGDPAAQQQDGDARVASQLRGDPDAVRHHGKPVPGLAALEVARDGEGRGAGVQHDALAVADAARRGRADAGLRLPLEPLPDLEGKLRAIVARSDRASVGADDPPFSLQDPEILSNGHRGDAEAAGELGHHGPPVRLDDPGDLLLALAGEDAVGQVGGLRGHGSLRLDNELRLVAIAHTLHRSRDKRQQRILTLTATLRSRRGRRRPAG